MRAFTTLMVISAALLAWGCTTTTISEDQTVYLLKDRKGGRIEIALDSRGNVRRVLRDDGGEFEETEEWPRMDYEWHGKDEEADRFKIDGRPLEIVNDYRETVALHTEWHFDGEAAECIGRVLITVLDVTVRVLAQCACCCHR